MATTPQPSMKKRQVIAHSNRSMFLWIAGMSAIVGICGVLSYFLIQQILFKGMALGQSNETVSRLKDNKKVVESLASDLRAKETDSALNSIKATPDEKALQVVLDALPADANAMALGSSLQQRLVSDIPDVTVESLTVQPVDESSVEPEAQQTTTGDTNSDVVTKANRLTFTLAVKSTKADSLKQLLEKFEKSIRTIDIDSLSVDANQGTYTMTIQAHAYYLPAKTVKLDTVTCIPKKGCGQNEKK